MSPLHGWCAVAATLATLALQCTAVSTGTSTLLGGTSDERDDTHTRERAPKQSTHALMLTSPSRSLSTAGLRDKAFEAASALLPGGHFYGGLGEVSRDGKGIREVRALLPWPSEASWEVCNTVETLGNLVWVSGKYEKCSTSVRPTLYSNNNVGNFTNHHHF